MKYLTIAMVVIFQISLVFGADSKYDDQPISTDESIDEILKVYESSARNSLAYFKSEYEDKRGRSFYVGGITEFKYRGVIASKPMGRVNFRSGDPIEITSQEVYDWLIVNLDGY